MNKPDNVRHPHVAARGGDLPRLLRSRSGNTAGNTHSKKASKISEASEKDERSSKTKIVSTKKAGRNLGGGSYLPRSTSKLEMPKRSRSASTSPSAWALSPGRPMSSPVPPPPPVTRTPASSGKREGKGGAVSSVFRFFRQNKVSPALEGEYHRYSVAYNRLLQWRFANARAAAAMAAVKGVAQKKLMNVWVRISIIRNLMVKEKAMIQTLKHQMKVYNILNSELSLLNEWGKLEPKNSEAVGRMVRKLSAISLCLPLVQNAEADITSVKYTISTATEVMDNIKAMILDMHWQVERKCFLLTELSVMVKQQKHYFQELEKEVTLVSYLAAQEKSLRAHHIQLHKELIEV
ncbi:QWRF motif-containing protein 7 [Striga hermonthica]|uniref:QWRF motif-containing protein 7 n=1 Tax=Striga hermonthica TaxID=68872 RepID=A0A9N7NSG5_STRHE|nr:QWRF motif-containing protein 7 [Striga hermonthica]